MVVQQINQNSSPDEVDLGSNRRISKRVIKRVKENWLRTVVMTSFALVMLIKRVLA